MAEIMDFKILKINTLHITGKKIKIKYGELENNAIPDFWRKCFDENIFGEKSDLENIYDFSYAGYMYNFTENDFYYTAGLIINNNIKTRKIIYDEFYIKETESAVAYIKGGENDVLSKAHYITEEEIKKTHYKINEYNYWCMEVYNKTRFTNPNEKGEVILDYYIPVVKR